MADCNEQAGGGGAGDALAAGKQRSLEDTRHTSRHMAVGLKTCFVLLRQDASGTHVSVDIPTCDVTRRYSHVAIVKRLAMAHHAHTRWHNNNNNNNNMTPLSRFE